MRAELPHYIPGLHPFCPHRCHPLLGVEGPPIDVTPVPLPSVSLKILLPLLLNSCYGVNPVIWASGLPLSSLPSKPAQGHPAHGDPLVPA